MATTVSISHLGTLMGGVHTVDQVGAEERAASLAKRSIKKSAKLWALDLAIRCIDLTTLEGQDTPGKVAALCAKALHPDPSDPSIPPVAAVCIYPALVPVAAAGGVDMVIDRGASLSGNYQKVFDEIGQVKEASGRAHLKVILETGELGTYDNVRRASVLAMAAGADFIKTSTGKIQPAATLPVALVMM